MDPNATQAKVQMVMGGALVATPWWASAMETINYTASTIAVVCGALIGLHGVYRLFVPRKPRR